MGGVADLDPLGLLAVGANAWLDACADPAVQRILLLDGPSVLGWERWREIGLRHGAGLIKELLTVGMAVGVMAQQSLEPLIHVLLGALDEAALYVARAEDPTAARTQMKAVLARLVQSLA